MNDGHVLRGNDILMPNEVDLMRKINYDGKYHSVIRAFPSRRNVFITKSIVDWLQLCDSTEYLILL